jgi:serine/threonine protein kinase
MNENHLKTLRFHPVELLCTIKGEDLLPVEGYRCLIERFDSGRFHRKSGGFGHVYFCELSNHRTGETRSGIVKHGSLDGSLGGSLEPSEELLESVNKNTQDELAMLARVEALGFTPSVLANFELKPASFSPSLLLFVQEHASGETLFDLKDHLSHQGRVEVLWYIFNAVDQLHAEGLFHTDLDLNHVYWDGETASVQFIDWGGGFWIPPSELNETSGRLLRHGGKTNLRAPEQEDWKTNPYTARCEIYQLGALAYYFLRDGQNPADDSPDTECFTEPDGIDLFLDQEIEGVPSFFRELIHKATRYDPSDRFSSVNEMIEFWRLASEPKPAEPELCIATTSGTMQRIGPAEQQWENGDLSVTFRYAQDDLAAWEISGSFEFMITHGVSQGNWSAAESLVIYQKPTLLRSTNSGEVFYLTVHEGVDDYDQRQPSDSLEEPTESVLLQNIETAEFFSVVERDGDYLIVQNQMTLETSRIHRNKIAEEYSEL